MTEAARDATSQAVEDWFYDRNGQPEGPFSAARIREMAASGALAPDTLVWTDRFGTYWRRLRNTSLLSVSAVQPPPRADVTNLYAWVLVAMLPIGAVAEFVFCWFTRIPIPLLLVTVIYALIYVVIGLFDVGQIEASGRNVRSFRLTAWAALCPPLYLIRRARALGRPSAVSFAWLFAWIGAAVAAAPFQLVVLGLGLYRLY